MNNNQSIRILRGTSEKIVEAENKTDLRSGQLLYNLDKNYLTVGDTDEAKVTKKPITVREVVGYVGDFKDDNTLLTSNTDEQYSIRYKDGVGLQFNNTVLYDDRQIPSATSSGLQSIAFGGTKYDEPDNTPTSANGKQAFAFGGSTLAEGDWSFSGGTNSKAYQIGSVAIGDNVQAGRTESEFNNYYWNPALNVPDSEGKGTSATNILDDNGVSYSDQPHYGVAIGKDTKALGKHSLAAGEQTLAQGTGSISFGYNNESNGEYSITVGKHNQANTRRSIALGYKNSCNGVDSIVGGYKSEVVGLDNSDEPGHFSIAYGNEAKAQGKCSFAFGQKAISKNDFTFTVGDYVTATQPNQSVFGVNNKTNDNALFIVGNGSWAIPNDPKSEAIKSNSFEVLRSGGFNSLGDSKIDGSLEISDNLDVTKNVAIIDGTLYIEGKNNSNNSIETLYDIQSNSTLVAKKSVKTNTVYVDEIKKQSQQPYDAITIKNNVEIDSDCNIGRYNKKGDLVYYLLDNVYKLDGVLNVSTQFKFEKDKTYTVVTPFYTHELKLNAQQFQLLQQIDLETLPQDVDVSVDKENITFEMWYKPFGQLSEQYDEGNIGWAITQRYSLDTTSKKLTVKCYLTVDTAYLEGYWRVPITVKSVKFNKEFTASWELYILGQQGEMELQCTPLNYNPDQGWLTLYDRTTKKDYCFNIDAIEQLKTNYNSLKTAHNTLDSNYTSKISDIETRLTQLGFKQESVTCDLTMVAGSAKYNTLQFLREGNFYLLKFDWGIDTDKNSTNCIIRDYKEQNSTTVSVKRPTWMPKLESTITTNLLCLTRINAPGALEVTASTVSCTINNDSNNSNNLVFTISIAEDTNNVDKRVQRINGQLLISMSNNLKFDPMSM